MYCVIQEIELRKENPYGHYKELEVYKNKWFINGVDGGSYSYRYDGERFKRPIKRLIKSAYIKVIGKMERSRRNNIQFVL